MFDILVIYLLQRQKDVLKSRFKHRRHQRISCCVSLLYYQTFVVTNSSNLLSGCEKKNLVALFLLITHQHDNVSHSILNLIKNFFCDNLIKLIKFLLLSRESVKARYYESVQ